MLEYRNPLLVWLKELRINIEVEYLNSLQSKSVATTPTAFQAFQIRESQLTIQRIREISTQIIENLDYLIDQIPIIDADLKLMNTNFSQINFEIQEIVKICRKKFVNYTQNKNKLMDSVWRGSQQINKLIEFFSFKKSVNNSQLESTLRKLKENFGELVNHLIKNESKVIVTALQKRTGMVAVKWSLLSCCSLAQNDAYICRLFIEYHKILRPLLEIVTNYWSESVTERQQIKAIALRVMTVLCANNTNAVQLLLQKSFIDNFLPSIITTESTDLVTEQAVDLMVELSRSLIEANDGNKTEHWTQVLINDFMQCLTKILETTDNHKIFLLSCSSVANISFVDSEAIIRNDVLNVMINGFNHKFDHIFIRDQIITVMANTSRKYPLEVVKSGGLVFILDSLHLKVEDFKASEELSALERIQQKVGVAIARLADNQSVSQVLFRLNVIKRLIELCKESKQRNYSQNVLIASIAALKRLSKVDKQIAT